MRVSTLLGRVMFHEDVLMLRRFVNDQLFFSFFRFPLVFTVDNRSNSLATINILVLDGFLFFHFSSY